MGAFFVNYQIRSTDQTAVVEAAGMLVQSRACISTSHNGWVSLYDETSENQDAYEIGRLGSELSARLETVVFAFLVHDSTMFVYYLFDNGDLLDEYHSTPPITNAAAEEDQRVRFTGRPEILMNYCATGTNRGDLEVALMRGELLVEGRFASTVYAEQRLHPLAAALQMDNRRTTLGYHDLNRQQMSIPDGRDFKRIDGKKLRRPAPRHIPPQIPRRNT